jgi:dipeptidyl aminopeptidase/acylaminoacyl peptidase
MRRLFFVASFFIYAVSNAQLTVEKIMHDPKWIGTQPSNILWSYDNKSVYFNWNPDNNISDSVYRYSLAEKTISKSTPIEYAHANAIASGNYNKTHAQIVYAYKGDLFLLDLKSNQTLRITRTDEQETNPKFVLNDEYISFVSNQNIFIWNIKTGITQQLIHFNKSGETIATTAFSGNRGGANNRNNLSRGNVNAADQQDQWLQQNQLKTSDVLKERKKKREARELYLKRNKDDDTLKNINIGDKNLQSLQVSPDARFITYRLYQPPTNTKNAIVPDYVTESGYTTDIPNRTKVGAAQGKYELYFYDKIKDTLFSIATDSIPNITDQPEYVKDYPEKFSNKKHQPRSIIFFGPYWNESGSNAFISIYSQDNKDRWLLLFDASSSKTSLIEHQHDDAWIGGPGINGFDAKQGWVNDNTVYFQSESTGYSHLYSYDINTQKKKAITNGNYEVQEVILSKDKQNFYLLTNEEHPGKQNWYRIKTDGSDKEKITSSTGMYEINLSPDEKHIAFRYSYINKPWELFVQENAINKKAVQVTDKSMTAEFKEYAWRETPITTITASDGKLIYAKIYEPSAAKKNNAAVIFVHGAGYLQNVDYGWSYYFREYMFNNLLADKGYTVIDIDYRASSGYGRDWRTGIYRHMGGKDLDDEVDAANFLIKEKGIDPTKIGMYGGSYGGFMTLMAMFTKPDLIKAGAALRPVTDWAHYNHGYTSNILNEPYNDSIAYALSSPINFASGLKNHLLICHGMVDQNVNFQDAVRLNQRLIELGKDNWEMAVYPIEDHGFVEPSSWTDEYKRILKLFDTWLK